MRLLLHHVDPVGRKVHRIPASSIEPHFSQTRQLTTQHPAYRLSLLRACEVLTSKALPTLPVKHRTAFLRQEDINICYRREAVTHGTTDVPGLCIPVGAKSTACGKANGLTSDSYFGMAFVS